LVIDLRPGGVPDRVEPRERSAFLASSRRVWNADKVDTWQRNGIDLVIGQRVGYRMWDLDGREYLDVHLNGGTYNLGHRNPRLIDALLAGLTQVDVGNHHFPAPARTALAERLVAGAGPGMRSAVFTNSGSEAIDVAIKCARRATGRRVIVSLAGGFHGHTGLAMCAGNPDAARAFLCDRGEEFTTVPFDDVPAVAQALARDEVAAVVLETIPATFGFPLPSEGYHAEVARLCRERGTLYIADEVQTGLMRTGSLWAITGFGVQPDILVTAKGLGGGLYPLGAAILSEPVAAWQDTDGWGHVSTTGGSELGCNVALEVLDMLADPCVAERVRTVGDLIGGHLDAIAQESNTTLERVDRKGLVIGLRFTDPDGGKQAMRALFERGVWAIYASFAPNVLQVKPGLLLDENECNQLLTTFDAALHAL
jgi:acetylornithine/succinyldiaminopimelate/putrescine aminotransferase